MTVETKVGVSGAWKELNGAPKVGVSGAWKDVSEIYAGDSGAWELVFVNFAVSQDAIGAGDSGVPATGTVTSSGTITSVTGGTAPITYTYVRVSVDQGQTQTANFTNPASNTNHSFTADNIPDGTPSINTWRVDAEDNDGNTSSATFVVTLTWTSTA